MRKIIDKIFGKYAKVYLICISKFKQQKKMEKYLIADSDLHRNYGGNNKPAFAVYSKYKRVELGNSDIGVHVTRYKGEDKDITFEPEYQHEQDVAIIRATEHSTVILFRYHEKIQKLAGLFVGIIK